MLALGRQLARQGGLLPSCRRTMAGDAYIPKPDKSMDHVFGDSSFKLPFDVGGHQLGLLIIAFCTNPELGRLIAGSLLLSGSRRTSIAVLVKPGLLPFGPLAPLQFQPPSTLKTFALTVVTFGIFGFPIWIYMYEDSKMQSFLKE
jgi:hypothetical protein